MAADDPGPVTERPAPTRRVRPVAPERARRPAPPAPPSSGGSHFWQALAIIALIVATAGWTATGMLLLRGDSTGTADIPTDTADPNAGADSSASPIPISHDVPDLEVRLPTAVNGTTLGTMSWTGDNFFDTNPWSTSMQAFLASKGLTDPDLQIAQAVDPGMGTDPNALDLFVYTYRAKGISPTDLRDAIIAGWKADTPELVVSDMTIDGRQVKKGDFGTNYEASYWYVTDDLVFDIQTTDESLVAKAIEAIPKAGASSAPAPSGSGAAPSHSAAPAGSPAASRAASPSPS
jgi:hypothetical protein